MKVLKRTICIAALWPHTQLSAASHQLPPRLDILVGHRQPALLRDVEAVQVRGPDAQPLDVGGGQVGRVVGHVHGALWC